MPLWGRNDQAVTANSTTTAESTNGAPIGVHSLVKSDQVTRVDAANAHFGNTSPGSRALVDKNLFGNTTPGAFIPGKAVGVFGIDATEMTVANGGLLNATVIYGGSGYGANAVVTVGAANVSSVNSTVTAGKVTALTVNVAGSYTSSPDLTIAAPAAINITANSTGFSNTNDTIVVSSANSRWAVGDRLYYSVPTANTPIAPLTGNTYYYVSFANTTVIKLASSVGGANIDLTDARVTASGETHTIRGDTATGAVSVGGAKSRGAAHAGWVLRTEGTGGRAGRVQYEVLVAMGSLGAQTAAYGTPAVVADAADDAALPDS